MQLVNPLTSHSEGQVKVLSVVPEPPILHPLGIGVIARGFPDWKPNLKNKNKIKISKAITANATITFFLLFFILLFLALFLGSKYSSLFLSSLVFPFHFLF